MKYTNSIQRHILQISFVSFIVFSTLLTFNRHAFAYVLFPWKWGSTFVQYDPHTMGAGWIGIASEGRQQWNNVSPSPFTISRNDSSSNDVFLGYVDGSGPKLGTTALWCGPSQPCNMVGQTVTMAVIILESTQVWHVDSNCMIPANAADARGVITHEFGHFSTLNHSSSGCGGSDPATMCSSMPLGTGGCAYRTLKSDDQAGLNAQYP
ncbi:MAG: hypothetical protein Fur0022_12370 [Anaerolineales bacterium]